MVDGGVFEPSCAVLSRQKQLTAGICPCILGGGLKWESCAQFSRFASGEGDY